MLTKNLIELEKIVKSELTSKLEKSSISHNELIIETSLEYLIETIQFLKSLLGIF